VLQLWAERGVLALVAYLMLLVLFVRECLRCSGGRSRPPAPGAGAATRAFAEAGIAVVVALTAAGLFEFNFGDTEVFWVLLDVLALVVFSLERPERSNEWGGGRVPGTSVTFPP
jgi:O-antigen ligase